MESNTLTSAKRFKGFTLIEILVTLSLLVLLLLLAVPAFHRLSRTSKLEQGVQTVVSALQTARQHTLASADDSRWGAYFSTSSRRIIAFKGSDFASRATSADRVFGLPEGLDFRQVNFVSNNEVVFARINSRTGSAGSTTLVSVGDPDRQRSVYLDSSGQVSLEPISQATESGRVTDARHIHFNYTRMISTSTEELILEFPGGVTKQVAIADNWSGGNFDWAGSVPVGGSDQKLRIRTLKVNDADTVFCIHRDARYNNKSLDVSISGDPAVAPDLIGYSADNFSVTAGNSIHVSSPVWH